ncbi:stomatal closure-related actin-binding protein 3-like isoform X3 [Cajanus cajan]|uniref:stomatal closure-related actin-binding protein 3-like isoform X3 n=1 Tax=Cajanus cajan TaxID=3821 RepID=UPI00098DBA14|nr:stomatal closure-related actin-binding protein 3-like isoform X3 [Cajanus cajan]
MLGAMERLGVTHLTVVPSVVVVVTKDGVTDGYSFKSLESVVCGGAPLGKETAHAFNAKCGIQAKLREVASLEGHVLLKKLRDALESLRGCFAGRNKEDVEKAIFMVEALAVKLTQNEGELIQEKFEVKKLVNFLKQASEDAKKLVNQEKSFACTEIQSARSVVLRIGEALEEQEKASQASKPQVLKCCLITRLYVYDVDGLIEEVQEARRIKLLH